MAWLTSTEEERFLDQLGAHSQQQQRIYFPPPFKQQQLMVRPTGKWQMSSGVSPAAHLLPCTC